MIDRCIIGFKVMLFVATGTFLAFIVGHWVFVGEINIIPQQFIEDPIFFRLWIVFLLLAFLFGFTFLEDYK